MEESSEEIEEISNPKHLFKNNQELFQLIKEGRTFQEIFGYSDQELEGMFHKANDLFQQQKYEEAMSAFLYLTTLNPNISTYWLGLGMSEQLLEEYSSALIAYQLAAIIDEKNPIPLYHSAHCHRQLWDFERAIEALEGAMTRCANSPEYSTLQESAENLKAILIREHQD